MADVTDELERAFEDAGYEVNETSVNRDRVRVSLLDPEASADDLRSVTLDVVDEADILGFDVSTESLDNERVTTVVSFRHRG